MSAEAAQTTAGPALGCQESNVLAVQLACTSHADKRTAENLQLAVASH